LLETAFRPFDRGLLRVHIDDGHLPWALPFGFDSPMKGQGTFPRATLPRQDSNSFHRSDIEQVQNEKKTFTLR
jgi:hypothetical protein